MNKKKSKKEVHALLWEWCKLRDMNKHDINWGSGDFYWDHMVAFGTWLLNREINK